MDQPAARASIGDRPVAGTSGALWLKNPLSGLPDGLCGALTERTEITHGAGSKGRIRDRLRADALACLDPILRGEILRLG